ncbi:hypothetical protein AAZX31_02G275100 [Glycine max]|uniref:Uncharacterized protein n=2 Tax=Glycine subgen. Soja TaxID=1462606 RepID=K7KBG7_SOYBN|nr:uncharacterized protein LOC100798628 [Glycine max]XP_028185337.1 uncharacterized protein LOC114372120 [Glycine soja]KAG5053383.1 hypothetical protein JHK87_005581 [Glycine soja]KAG5064710.1 hypothetical protein JHK85_005893 [Glycine max]KAG5081677.1 hypothetical protein JHK86_005742 [Glycine max]KAH1062699.1 hypothetical protein GYH30_005584 [Glycine max]KAH1263735.1 hypothetical protein GmHk_02G006059 [Glycine max]|eukprot:XP_003519584.1 uncharacterized protein LOC100798628 [Glycine max]
MKCLQLQSSLLPLHAKLKPQPNHTSHTSQIIRAQHFPLASDPLTTKALPHSMVVAPAQSGDLSTFLPISAVLLSAYFIANFVVPGFLTNSFGYDKSNEEQKVDDSNEIEDE